MRVRFGELSSSEQAALQQRCAQAREAWSRLQAGETRAACELFAGIDPRIELRLDAACVDAPDDPGDMSQPFASVVAYESSAWPLAERLLQQAPEQLGRCLALGRAAQPLPTALAEIEAEYGVSFARASLRAGFARGHLLEVTLGVPGGSGAEIEQISAENLVRSLLGDRVFETWIGAVHAQPAPRLGSLRVLDSRAAAPQRELDVAQLFDTVAAATRAALLSLPERAHALLEHGAEPSDARAEWTLFEIEPFADAAADRKHDMLLASSRTPELLRCYLEGAPCASRRFSRAGEQFVFLSYADAQASTEQRLARRGELERELAITLEGVGSVSGVGLGLHTSYIDFALCDLEAGLARLVTTCRQLGVPRHSFVQFFDSELAEEWLSIWPDSRLTAG